MPSEAPAISSATPPSFYVTTPIYYVNARPHIGHAYTTLVADTVARRHRLLGHPTFFLTGTDEHGQKIERSATAAGIPPQQFADQVSASFRALWDRMGITYTDYIRTTEPRHKQGVQHLFQQLQQNGAIYKGTYTGQYCVSDEAYVDGPPGIHCPDCGRLTETVSESNYYFRLSQFQRPLLDLIESNTLHIQPDSRRNEVLSFLRGPVSSIEQSSSSRPEESAANRSGETPVFAPAHTPGAPSMAQPHRDMGGNVEGSHPPAQSLAHTAAGTPYVPGALKDLSISRTSFRWGIPVPGDEDHVIYVWLDALANYMTALGYGHDPKPLFDQFWPANLHLVGKEIIRFHCVYWPAFLLALNPNWATTPAPGVIPSEANGGGETPAGALAFDPAWAAHMLPNAVVAHGWLLFEESKMSKSRGNIVRTETILDSFGDHYRRELLRLGQPEPTKPAADLFATDVLRYFLLREIPFGQDGSFSFDSMITRYNADLANGYGNLVSRTLAMIEKNLSGAIPHTEAAHHHGFTLEEAAAILSPGHEIGLYTRASTAVTIHTWQQALGSHEFARALDAITLGVTIADGFITQKAPWKLAKLDTAEARVELMSVLYTAAESIRILTALLYPILPYSTAKVWAQLGLGDIEQAARDGHLRNLQWGGLQPGTRLGPLAPIFPRAPKELAQTMADIESTAPRPTSTPADLTNVATDAHDAATPTRTPFAEAPLASTPAGTTDQPVANEAVLEAKHQPSPQTPGAPFLAQSHRDTSGNAGGPDGPAQTGTPTSGDLQGSDPTAPPRPLSSPNPIAAVAGSTATTTAQPGAPVPAEPTGSFAASAPTAPTTPIDSSPQITIDDFAKVELRVAKVLVCERIPKADKLLRLEVDLGYERRQILSGIAEWYTPEDLIGRRIVVITNLAPRKMRGLDSHGMLLAASAPEGGKPALATFADTDTSLPLGSRLK